MESPWDRPDSQMESVPAGTLVNLFAQTFLQEHFVESSIRCQKCSFRNTLTNFHRNQS